jgi:dTDP-4-dehydrorhamnose 3,5-epimerase
VALRQKATISGVHVFDVKTSKDNRGEFFKTFTIDLIKKYGLDFELHEEFFSVSHRDVIRGMHFQIPPFDHNKMVFCVKGRVLDVVLDLRSQSETFGQHFSIELSSDNRQVVLIPKGVAHGFLSLQDNSILAYKTDSQYSEMHDMGIHWDSFGMSWGGGDWIVSDRDKKHVLFADFRTPF